MKYVLFVCNHNPGSPPASAVWPTVIEAMAELGLDLSGRKPRKLLREMQHHADWAVTMGWGDACPYVPTTVEAWDIPDPAGLPLDQVRPIHDQIRACADAVLSDYDDVPLRGYVRQLAHRRTRECLLKDTCDALTPA